MADYEGEQTPKNQEGEGQPDEDASLDESELGESDDNSTSSKELESALAQKRHWKEKYEKVEKIRQEQEKKIAEFEKRLKELSQTTEQEENDILKELKAWKEEADFLLRNKDYDPDEFQYLKRLAQAKGLSLAEASQDDEVKEILALRREKLENEKKTPEPSSASAVKKEKDVAKMSDEEFQKLEEEYLRKQTKEISGV